MAGGNWMHRTFGSFKRRWKTLRGSSGTSIETLPSEVRPDEVLSSFVFRESDVDKKTGRIHYSRLVPRPAKTTGRLETSVCRSSGLSEAELWAICAAHFDPYAPKPAIGHGVGDASTVMSVGLRLHADGVPYREHANIVGWEQLPGTTGGSGRDVRLHAARTMSAQFVFRARVSI